jgi:signal transduction histidine kinase
MRVVETRWEDQPAFLTSLRDVTDRKRAEEARAQLIREQAARAEAERVSRMKDEFLATVSHELRTPLHAILGWAKLLHSRNLDEASMKRALETIERNAKLQALIVEDLLDVSRIVSGKLRLDFQPAELAPIINAAIDIMRPAADAKSIRLPAPLDAQVGLVLIDPNRMQQVIWNQSCETLIREIVFRLLVGGQGARLSHLLGADADTHRISRRLAICAKITTSRSEWMTSHINSA